MTKFIKINHNGEMKHGFIEIPEIIEAEQVFPSLHEKNQVGCERQDAESTASQPIPTLSCAD